PGRRRLGPDAEPSRAAPGGREHGAVPAALAAGGLARGGAVHQHMGREPCAGQRHPARGGGPAPLAVAAAAPAEGARRAPGDAASAGVPVAGGSAVGAVPGNVGHYPATFPPRAQPHCLPRLKRGLISLRRV
ncbi:unnamed protein product, partial [Prorocentrum cordatum]